MQVNTYTYLCDYFIRIKSEGFRGFVQPEICNRDQRIE